MVGQRKIGGPRLPNTLQVVSSALLQAQVVVYGRVPGVKRKLLCEF